MKKWTEIEGPFQEHEGNTLQGIARGKIVLEIGSWYGRSTACLAEVASHVCACDPHTAFNTQILGEEFVSLDKFKKNTEGYNNITLLLGKSEDMVPPLEDSFFDLIFIDGCHNYPAVKLDIELCLPKLKEGGTMAFHDWGWNGNNDGGVIRAVKEKFRKATILAGGLAMAINKEGNLL